MAQPWSDVVLSGAATVAQLAGNTAALRLDPALDATRLVRPQPAADYWAERGRLPWS
jgi:aryl-alcohol dehydrogenase-like predicted oxidoreductase